MKIEGKKVIGLCSWNYILHKQKQNI